MYDYLEIIGSQSKSLILAVAKFLTNDSSPGLIATGLIILPLFAVLRFSIQTQRKKRAVLWIYKLIEKYETPHDFTSKHI